MKILHAADIHVTHRGDKEEQAACLAAMVEAAQTHRVDIICLAGDFVEPAAARVQEPWERETWRQCLAALAQAAPVLMIRGNHDVPGDVSHFSDIPNVTYRDAPGVVTIAGATVAMLPYRSAAEWAASAEGPMCPTIVETAEERMRAWLQRVRPSEGIALAMFHGAIEGCTVQLAQGAMPRVGHQPHLRPEDFAGYDLAMLGDIHLPQEWALSTGGTVAYPGSPWPMNHGEEGVANRGVLIWTVEAGRTPTCERVRLPYSELRTGELEWSDGALRWSDGVPFGGFDGTGWLRRADVEGARVRLKVRYPKGVELLDLARFEAQLREAGAKSVQIDRVTVQDAVAKVPELAAPEGPTTLHGRLQAVFASGALEGPTGPEHADWLVDACEQLEARGTGSETATVKVRKYRRIELHNLGRWQGETLSLDLADKQGLIRLHGHNGAGKTTLMAFLGPALAYLECPNRGSAREYAGYGNSFAEVTFAGGDGKEYRARIEITRRVIARGANKGKDAYETAGYVWVDGALVVDGKISEYQAFMEGVFGDATRFYLQVYAAQRSAAVTTSRSTSFTESAPAERDEFFRQSLELDVMGAWEAQCGERAKAALAPVEELQRQEAALRQRKAEAEALAQKVEAAATAATEAERAVEVAKAAADKSEADKSEADKQLAQVQAAAERAEALRCEAKGREKALEALSVTRAQVEALAAAIPADEAAVTAAETKLETVRVAAGSARAALDARANAQREVDEAGRALAQARQRRAALEADLEKAAKGLAQMQERLALERARVEELAKQDASASILAAELAALEAASKRTALIESWQKASAESAKQASVQAEAQRAADLAATAQKTAQERVERAEARLREIDKAEAGIAGVGCAGKGPNGGWFPCPLIQGAADTVAQRGSVQQQLADAKADASTAAATVSAAVAALAAATQEADAAKSAVDALVKEGTAAKRTMEEAQGALARLREQAADVQKRLAATKDSVATLQRQIAEASDAALRAQLADAMALIAEREKALAAAQERLAALPTPDASATAQVQAAEHALALARKALASAQQKLSDARTALAAMQARCEALRTAEAIEADLNTATAEAEGLADAHWAVSEAAEQLSEKTGELRRAVQAAQQARTERDTLTGRLQALTETLGGLDELVARLDAARREHHWWSELGVWIRRLATLTIEAAAPELSAYVNDFLHACFGDRFVVRIEAETENKGNSGVKRTYAVLVTDTHSESPEERPLTTYSGGEQNPVRQALAFGLMLFSNHKSPRRWGVAFVDEADGGLDPAAQLLWQQMLRRFVEFGSMRQVFVVTHMDLAVADHVVECAKLRGQRGPVGENATPANADAAQPALAAELPF